MNAKLKKRKIIWFLSNAGSVTKTTLATTTVETLRFLGKSVDAYTLDSNHQKLYERLGERDESGKLIPIEEQDPNKGVAHVNVSNEEEKQKLIKTFRPVSNAEYLVYDWPSNSKEAAATMYEDVERLMKIIARENAELIIVCPIVDAKSIQSLKSIADEFLEARIIAAINAGYIKKLLPPKAAKAEIQNLVKTFQDYEQFNVSVKLSDDVFALMDKKGEEKSFRDLYIPRVERMNDDGSFYGEEKYEHLDPDVAYELDEYITDMTKQVKELFIDN